MIAVKMSAGVGSYSLPAIISHLSTSLPLLPFPPLLPSLSSPLPLMMTPHQRLGTLVGSGLPWWAAGNPVGRGVAWDGGVKSYTVKWLRSPVSLLLSPVCFNCSSLHVP